MCTNGFFLRLEDADAHFFLHYVTFALLCICKNSDVAGCSDTVSGHNRGPAIIGDLMLCDINYSIYTIISLLTYHF